MKDSFTAAAMRYAKSPGISEAGALLNRLADLPVACAPRKVDKPLILYGAGNLGEMAKAYFDRLEIPLMYVIDQSPDRLSGNSRWNGISIRRPQDVPHEHRSGCLLAVCIVTQSFEDISDALKRQGWADVVPFYDIAEAYKERHPLGNGWFAGDLQEVDLEAIACALNRWDDDVSRAQHLQFLAWHRVRQELKFDDAPIIADKRFFIPQIVQALGTEEVFIDGGAHHGEVSLRFLDIVQRRFKQIYAFEPDKFNIRILHSRFNKEDIAVVRHTHILECALGKQNVELPFYSGLDYASQFSSLSAERIAVKALDEMNIPATFIKFHLEGWEYDALLGSMLTLNQYRPILAVTIYHSRDGLWRIPGLLMNNLQDYSFLLRNHSWMGTGCVVYAIPRERCIT